MALEVCINTVYNVLSNLELANLLKDVVKFTQIQSRKEEKAHTYLCNSHKLGQVAL